MNKNTRVTMQDIADVARVTKATVSMALRNHHEIPKETCERIQQIAQSMGYKLNLLLSTAMSNIRTQRSFPYQGTIAYISNWPHPDSWMKRATHGGFFEGARSRAEQAGYKVEHLWAKNYASNRGLERTLTKREIHGVIVMPFWMGKVGHLTLNWDRYASASVGFSMATPHLHYACNNQENVIVVPLRKLKQLGYRRIGLAIDKRIDIHSDYSISLRFQHHLQHVPASQRVPMYIPDKLSENEKGCMEWYHKYKPDVIICFEPLMVDWLNNRGLEVPKDVGVVFLDVNDKNRKVADWAGMHQYSEEIGAAAADLVIEQLNRNQRGIPTHRKAVLIDSKWVQGITVRQPKKTALERA